ncbi:hypothetical protein [Mycoplasma leonicaptivi]|uniref:hypothetical protein n=1 Tax=Mycoplasma leonicaptivi TaxID=36742 RepID=UPI00048918D7|nr:hypothetical protein [Mycoplasma leonicaptivi]
MYTNTQQTEKYQNNYLKRKVLLITLLIFSFSILVISLNLIFKLSDRIQTELNWISSGDISQSYTLEEKLKLSETNSLWTLFNSMNSIVIVLSIINIFIILFMLFLIYTNKSNADKYFRILFWTIPIIFILLFFIISLQPAEVKRINLVLLSKPSESKTSVSSLEIISQGESLSKISYAEVWLAMILAFLSIFVVISAKKSLGFVTKDFILAKKLIDTSKLKKQLEV